MRNRESRDMKTRNSLREYIRGGRRKEVAVGVESFLPGQVGDTKHIL